VARLSVLCTGQRYSPWDTPGTHFCERLSWLQDHSVARRIKWMKNSDDPHMELNPWPSGLQCSASTKYVTVYPFLHEGTTKIIFHIPENVYWAERYKTRRNPSHAHMHAPMHAHTHPHKHTEQLFLSVKGYMEFLHYFKILKFVCVYSTLSCRTCNDVLWNSGWKTAIHVNYWNTPRL